jgi:hypothetical protein
MSAKCPCSLQGETENEEAFLVRPSVFRMLADTWQEGEASAGCLQNGQCLFSPASVRRLPSARTIASRPWRCRARTGKARFDGLESQNVSHGN